MIYLSLLAALLLFIALVATIARSFHTESDLNFGGWDFQEASSSDGRNDDASDAHNLEIFLRAFSGDDQRFVETLGDSGVQRLLAYERKRIALGWIRRKTAEARFIMREHARRARKAKDLNVSAEIRLALQYLELLALFELLTLTVFIFGPAGLQKRALQTIAILSDIRRFGGSAASNAMAS